MNTFRTQTVTFEPPGHRKPSNIGEVYGDLGETQTVTQDVRVLTVGQSIEREIAGGETHSYKIQMGAAQYLSVVVDQHGIDVVVTLLAPDQRKLSEVDSPNGAFGPEVVLATTETLGEYRLEVRALEANAVAGKYELRIEELRAAREEDKSRIATLTAAREARSEAIQLLEKGGAESFRSSIEKYEKALTLWRLIGDKYWEAFSLSTIGDVYDSLGESQKALDYYSQALPPRRAVGDRVGEAITLGNIGKVYSALGEKQKALDHYNQALPLRRAVGDRAGEAITLNDLGAVYRALGEQQKALNYFNQALPLKRAVGDRAGEALSLASLGAIYSDLDERQKAVNYYTQALPLWRAVGNVSGEAMTLTNLGKVYDSLAEKQKALDCFNQALPLWHAAGSRGGEATTLNNLGAVYDDLGEHKKALDYYNQALTYQRALADQGTQGATLNNIGKVYYDLGEHKKAIDYYNQALLLIRAAGNRSGEAATLNNLGRVYKSQGETERALDYYTQGLRLWRALGDHDSEAMALSNIGAIYSALGEQQKALDYYNQALAPQRAVGDRNGEATTLTNLGAAYDILGQQQKALGYYNQALTVWRAVGNRESEAITLNNLGVVYKALGQTQRALDYYNQALALQRAVGDREGEATTLTNLGAAYEILGEPQKALDFYNQTLPVWRAVGNREGEAVTLDLLMVALKVDNTALAIFYGKQAINTYQQLRSNISGLDKTLQQTFLHSKEDTYRELADLLISKGRLPEAQQVLGLLKEQEYFDFVRRDASVSALLQRSDLTPEEEAAVKRYNEKADQITKIAGEFSTLKAGGASPTDARYQTLKADLEAANRAFQVVLRQIADEFGKEPEKGKAIVKDVQENKGLQADLKRWGGGTVSLYTVLGEENYHVILTTPTLQVARESNPAIKAVDLNKLILQFREAVQDPKVDPRPLAQQLFKILIAPVEKDLEAAGAKTLVWSLDGTLRYLPIAALHDGQQYVVEHYQNVIITLASRTRLSDQPTKNWHGLGLGVSKGVVKEWGTFRPLPSVPAELHGIIREEKQNPRMGGILPGRVMLDATFTEQAMEAALSEGRYPLVHIASHFQFKPGNETDSFLLLGDGNRLTLDKIRVSASLFFEGVELLTLSACDTATGGDANGKEVEGFAVLAQEQGARAVLATLWPVADESTRLLMEKFYQLRSTKSGMAKVEALRRTQLALLHPQTTVTGAGTNSTTARIVDKTGPAVAFKADPNAPFAHPYYWAPFILIGNWR